MGLSIKRAYETQVRRLAMTAGVAVGCFALALVAGSILMIPSSSDAVEGDLVAVDAAEAMLSVEGDASAGVSVVTNSVEGYRTSVGERDGRMVVTVTADY